MSNAMDEVATLAADLRAWLNWQGILGASALPRESVPPTERVEIKASPAKPRQMERPPDERIATSKAGTKSVPKQTAAPSVPTPQAEPTKASPKPAMSDRWKALMAAPTTHRVSGPAGAPLTIVRGSGSSADAEAMLDRMLENVLKLHRDDVCLIDLNRDSRTPTEIGEGLRQALPNLKPSLLLLMGRFAVQALYGEEASLDSMRNEWTKFEYPGGSVPLRVTHHPEAILLLGSRGDSAPKRDTFQDLKAVGERLTST